MKNLFWAAVLAAALAQPALARNHRDAVPPPPPAPPAALDTPEQRTAQVRVIRVLDGDTFEIEVPGDNTLGLTLSVRVRGINTPERHSRCGRTDAELNRLPQAERAAARAERDRMRRREQELAEQATAQAIALLMPPGGDAMVTIRNYHHDKYGGRINATVILADGSEMAERMIALGLADPYNGTGERNWCGR